MTYYVSSGMVNHAQLCRCHQQSQRCVSFISLTLSAVKLVTDVSCCHGHVVTLIRPL